MSEISREQMMAYADGQLEPSAAAELEAYLTGAPEAAAEIALMRRQTDAIRTLFAPVAAEPVPARLRARRLAAELSKRQQGRWRLVAAAVLLLSLGIGAGWIGRSLDLGQPPSAALIADAVNAHTVFVAENRHAVEVPANDREHLSTWLSNRLETPLGIPDLSREGLELVGGRLLPAVAEAGGRAAQLMYQNNLGERITIYVTAALPEGAPAYRYETVGAAEAFYWANARITCTVVGSLPEAQMEAVSRVVYRQLGTLAEPVPSVQRT